MPIDGKAFIGCLYWLWHSWYCLSSDMYWCCRIDPIHSRVIFVLPIVSNFFRVFFLRVSIQTFSQILKNKRKHRVFDFLFPSTKKTNMNAYGQRIQAQPMQAMQMQAPQLAAQAPRAGGNCGDGAAVASSGVSAAVWVIVIIFIILIIIGIAWFFCRGCGSSNKCCNTSGKKECGGGCGGGGGSSC